MRPTENFIVRSALLIAAMLASSAPAQEYYVRRIVSPEYGSGQGPVGQSMAFQGDLLVTGTSGPWVRVNESTRYSRAVIYRRNSAGALQWEQELFPSALSEGATGKAYVSLSGNRVAVGWPNGNSIPLGGHSTGRVEIFRHNGQKWVSEKNFLGLVPTDNFGCAVALADNWLAAGVQKFSPSDGVQTGAVHLFEFASGTWQVRQTLVGDEALVAGDFGRVTAVSDEVLLVGAPGESIGAASAGGVYVYRLAGGVWSREARIAAPTPAIGERFGQTVAIDGETIVAISAGDGASAGAARVYQRDGANWPLQQTITLDDIEPGMLATASVSLAGDRLAIGAGGPDTAGDGEGVVLLFKRAAGVWARVDLLEDAAAANDDRFGSSVALNGDELAVGAPGGLYVRVYEEDGDQWDEEVELVPSTSTAERRLFGTVVALGGTHALIGERWGVYGFNDPVGTIFRRSRGFERINGEWAQVYANYSGQAREAVYGIVGDRGLVSRFGDGGANPVQLLDLDGKNWTSAGVIPATGPGFGSDIAYDAGTLVVGESKMGFDMGVPSLAIYAETEVGFSFMQTLAPPTFSTALTGFAVSSAISGDRIVVGAPQTDAGGLVSSGAAATYVRTGGVWAAEGVIQAPTPAVQDYFGTSVAVAGDSLFSSAPMANRGASDTGSVYVYRRNAGAWEYAQELQPGAASANTNFGAVISAEGSVLAVGAPGDVTAGQATGAVYIYHDIAGTWQLHRKLQASTPQAGARFGETLMLRGGNLIIGAPFEDAPEESSGAVYIFEALPLPAAANANWAMFE